MRFGGLTAVVLALGCGESKSSGTCASIEFADPNVDAAVRKALVGAPPQGPLTPGDVVPLVKLRVSDAADLSGVECLTGLIDLGLYSPAGPSLSPLAALSLQIFAAYDGSVRQPEALARVTTLEQLSLDGVGVSDLSFIAGLAELATLSVTGSPVSSLSPLAGLTRLQSVIVENTRVAELAPLGELARLSTINVSGSQVSELDGVPAPSKDVRLACFYARNLPLSPHAISTGIPALCDLGWSVSWSTADLSTLGSCNASCDK